jgi:membrane-associated phospholipid phosphatase
MNLTRVVKNLFWINVLVLLILSILGIIQGGWRNFQHVFDKITLNILNHHSPLADTFFKYFTQLAELPLILLSIGYTVYQLKKESVYWLLSFLIFALILQSVKLGFNFPRPIIRFPEYIRQIDGLFISSWKAFPSGHTANAVFATGLLIVSYKKDRTLTAFGLWIAFLFVLGIGFSRVYLGQHSTEDVIAGSAFGLWFWWMGLKFEDRGTLAIRKRIIESKQNKTTS